MCQHKIMALYVEIHPDRFRRIVRVKLMYDLSVPIAQMTMFP